MPKFPHAHSYHTHWQLLPMKHKKGFPSVFQTEIPFKVYDKDVLFNP